MLLFHNFEAVMMFRLKSSQCRCKTCVVHVCVQNVTVDLRGKGQLCSVSCQDVDQTFRLSSAPLF